LHIAQIEPTPFFIRDKDELLQGVDVTIENREEPAQASMDARFGLKERHIQLGKIDRGQGKCRIYVPDVRHPTRAEFVLRVAREVHDRRKMIWEPKKHWQVCMVPIAHHDFGYTDTIENVLRQYDSFYDNILRFCEETDEWPEESKFRYHVEASWSIQHFTENRPKRVLKKLSKYVKEGRIEIPAFFGNQITGLCSHEELIRLMYPSFRLKRKLGAKIRTASITDIPGLSWGLPTVLAGAGIRYFFAGLATYFEWGRNDIHTFWDEDAILRKHGRPDAFLWKGPDGEEVLVYYQGGYGCWSPRSYQEALDELPGMLAEMEERGCPFSTVRYGGYGCGDNTPPDVRVSHIAREWNRKWAYPRLIVATNSIFFEKLEKECENLRVFRGELPHTDYVVGALCSARETGVNRVTHERLSSAEKVATIASLVSDFDYPAEEVREAYDNLLLYDEHTWGMSHQYGEVQDWDFSSKTHCAYKAAGLAGSILSRGLDAIASEIGFEEKGRYVVVFNPLSKARTDLVRVSRFAIDTPFDLIDEETGDLVLHQVVEIDTPQLPMPYAPHRYARGKFDESELFDLVFVAEEVPPLGYKSFRILPKEEASTFASEVVVGERTVENRFFKVTLDERTGAIESVYDKELGRQIVDEDAEHKLNQLVVRWVKDGLKESLKESKIRKGQDGPVYGSLVVSSQSAGCPQLTQEIILYDKIKRIDLLNRVLKDSTPNMEMYFAFPFKVRNPTFRFEGSNSVIEPLVDQFEGSNSNYYAVQHWADVSDGEVGVTLSSIESHLLEFGGLWPCYVSQAHHGVTPPDFGRDFVRPDEMRNGYIYSFFLDSNFRTNFQPAQQGDMLFRYSITTHKGDWKGGAPRDFGWGIGNPLIACSVEGRREGRFGKKMSFFKVDKPNILLLTLKQAEDGDGIIARLIETEGRAVTATLTLPFLTIKKAYKTNLVEENENVLSTQEHAVTTPVRAFGITTIRIRVVTLR